MESWIAESVEEENRQKGEVGQKHIFYLSLFFNFKKHILIKQKD